MSKILIMLLLGVKRYKLIKVNEGGQFVVSLIQINSYGKFSKNKATEIPVGLGAAKGVGAWFGQPAGLPRLFMFSLKTRNSC